MYLSNRQIWSPQLFRTKIFPTPDLLSICEIQNEKKKWMIREEVSETNLKTVVQYN